MNDADLPLVSVVTPSLNQGRFIEQAIASVLEQDYPRVEHVVVDGGSTDETLEILRAHGHLRWVSEPDAGQASAINKGFRMVEGSIYGWLNADDYYLPGAISAAVEVLRTTDCAFVHGGWLQVNEEGAVLRQVRVVPFDYHLELDHRNAVCQPGSFFTSDAYWAVGGVDESYQFAMDYELWLKLGARFSVGHVDRAQAAYRYHSESKSTAQYAAFGPETLRASRSHGGRFLSPMYLDSYLPHEHPALNRIYLAARLLRAGEMRDLWQRFLERQRRVWRARLHRRPNGT
ncbi:MAG TPA: glycosyltransferase family 2 protein [Gaiellaceae bacterium]|nr:glycosyltransferase family 2 protein [Gaiellaceae bacterium]